MSVYQELALNCFGHETDVGVDLSLCFSCKLGEPARSKLAVMDGAYRYSDLLRLFANYEGLDNVTTIFTVATKFACSLSFVATLLNAYCD